MPITGFEFPGVELTQVFANTPAPTMSEQSVACIGPQYKLHKAADVDNVGTRSSALTGTYDPIEGIAAQVFPGLVSGEHVEYDDHVAQHLVIENAAYQYATARSPMLITIKPDSTNFVYKYSQSIGGTVFKWTAVTDGATPSVVYTKVRIPVADGRDPTPTYSDAAATTEVVNGAVTDTSVVITTQNKLYFPIYISGPYTNAAFGSRGMKVGDALILVGDSEVSAPIKVLKIDKDNRSAYISSSDATTYATLLASVKEVRICEVIDSVTYDYPGAFTTEEATVDNVLVPKVAVLGGLSTTLADLSDRSAELQAGDFYFEYRGLITTYSGTIQILSDMADVVTYLGTPSNDNPLALACYFALSQSGGNVVYFTTVKETDPSELPAAYVSAIELFAEYDNVYSIVPCTDDEDVISACMQKCIADSTDTESRIRRSLWYGRQTPKTITLFSGNATLSNTTITSGNTTAVCTFADDVYMNKTWRDGDKVSFYNDDAELVAGPYPTKQNLNSTNSLVVDFGTDSAPAAFTSVKLIRTNPLGSELVDAVIALRCTNSERGQFVWADDAVYNGEVIPNFALAAAAAGMRSYEPPQRPISMIQYSLFSVNETHKFTRAELRRIGANGVWIIGNNIDNNPVNMRQMTTAVANNLNMDEESIVSNADNIAYNLMGIGQDYVGKSNITPELIQVLAFDIDRLLTSFTLNTTGSVYIGPQILSYSIVDIYQDPVNLDHVIALIEVEPPKPFNRFIMTLTII